MLCCADVHGLLLLWFSAFNSWIKITFPEWSWEVSYRCRTMQLLSKCVTLSIWHLDQRIANTKLRNIIVSLSWLVCRRLWKPLPARWEFQYSGGTHWNWFLLTATWCFWLHAEGTCWITHRREVWSLTLNKKLNSNALAAPGGCQKCENCKTIKLCPILLLGFAVAPYQWTC